MKNRPYQKKNCMRTTGTVYPILKNCPDQTPPLHLLIPKQPWKGM